MNWQRSKIITCLAVLVTVLTGVGPSVAQALQIDPTNGYYIPDYFNTPNWANSPPLAKFVDPLPQLGDTGIPIARPDVVTYPGADYYEISLEQYSQQMHSAMPSTTLRGYVQTNKGTDTTGCGGAGQPACTVTNNTLAPAPIRYLGPVIVANKGRPVRITFTNNLPGGDHLLPVDPTVMGSGGFMINYDPETKAPITMVSGTFSQSRATLHLHGGLSPWISDGTTHQWTVPVNETTVYPKGVSVSYVPDMWFDAAGNSIAACAGLTTCGVAGATNNPGPGKLTFYWTNDQSARFMFYHDHAYGITRLNVYAGEAAGYLINDAALEDQLAGLGVPGTIGTTPATTDLAHLVPLVIQDKTFVDASTIATTDPTWAWGTNPGKPATTAPVNGDLWWPHVYMPAQNPYNLNMSGINDMGRWHYGPWFFPPTPLCGSSPDAVKPYCVEFGPVANEYYDPACDPAVATFCQPPERPGTHNPSWGAEAFLDTMVVNGAAYPTLTVQPAKYRLRILNASDDRFLNLQTYKASPIVSGITVTLGGSGYRSMPAVTITPAVGDITGHGATATAVIDPVTGAVTAIDLDTVGSGYTAAPTVTIALPPPGGVQATATAAIHAAPTEVGMVPAALSAGFPSRWPVDGREGGVPDPATRGPAFIQIGTEGGVLPAPVVLANQPVQWNTDPTMFNFGNVLQQKDGGGTLFLGPAERADVIVDFTDFAGQTLILYNDAPTAFPALVPQYDYYTGAPDRTGIGGYGPVLPGMGPNIRTVMQIVVGGGGGAATPDSYDPALLTSLRNAFKSTATTQGIFAQTQHPIIVGQSVYGSNGNSAYYTAGSDCDPVSAGTQTCFPAVSPYWGLSNIFSTDLKYDTVMKDTAGVIGFQRIGDNEAATPLQMKAIHDEMGASFDDYGRMSAKMGLEVPFVNAAIANFILQNFVDPVTEVVKPDEVQIWRISHNGVDTHPIHFHLFDVQLINRVGWDGFIRLPDDNELGWKDTLRISPLEDTIVALRPVRPSVPFKLPNSVRPLNPTMPLGDTSGFAQIDITDGGNLVPLLANQLINFGHEYTWHCHILSHEENDMMRATILAVPPEAPSNLAAAVTGSGKNRQAILTWTDNSLNETSFTIQRATDTGFTAGLVTFGTVGANVTTYTDVIGNTNQIYYYRVFASNAVGGPAPYPVVTADSGFSNAAGVNLPPAAPSNVLATAFRFNTTSDKVTVTWTDNSNNETGFRIQWATNASFTAGLSTGTVNANIATFTTGNLPRGATYYFRVQAMNSTLGNASAWVNASNNPVTTP